MVYLNPIKALLFTLIFCVFIFIIHFLFIGSGVWGDGQYYYSTAHSLSIDQDFDFDNEYRHFSINEPLSDIGLRVNKYPPGTSLVWLPVLFIIGIFDCATTFSLCSQIGYSPLYQISIGLTNIILVVVGLYFIFLTLSKYYRKNVSLYATLTTLFTTNLLFYTSFDPINSHPVSFFFSSVLLYILLTYKNSVSKWIITGSVFAWSALTRTLDIILAIPLIYILLKENKGNGKRISSLLSLVIPFTLFFSIQLLFWNSIYGYIQSPYLTGSEGFSISNPRLLDVLFNKDTGLIIWNPFVVLGFIALFKLKQYFKWIFIITIVIAYYLIASWSSWDQGGSFGTRMMITYLPFVSFGFASIFDKKKWVKYIKISPLSLILTAGFINISFILTYLYLH